LTSVLSLSAPIAVRSLDRSSGFRDLKLPLARSGASYHGLAVLVRTGVEPVGWLGVEVPPTGEIAGEVLEHACADLLADCTSGKDGQSAAPTWDESSRTRALSTFVSHVITTCNQASVVVRCVQSILASDGGPFEVIVVENRPEHSTVRDAVESALPGDDRIRVLEESIPGLSRARNAGLRAARGDFVTFTDDDIVVDPHWAGAVREAFAVHTEASCVTGPILPLELETPAQLMMERFAAFGKGFVRRLYSLDHPPGHEQPLFPYTAGYFGSGANTSFRREALMAIGGFDTALGTGTPARGAEDLDIFIRLIFSGRGLLYEPCATVWHRHPDTMEQISQRAFGYGVGLGAMLAKQLVTESRRAQLIQNIPGGLRYLLSPDSRKNAGKGAAFPHDLNRLELAGLAWGPAAYAHSRWVAKRHRAQDQSQFPRLSSTPTLEARRVWSGQFEVSDPDVPEGPLLASEGTTFDEARLLVRVLGEPVGFVTVPLMDGYLRPELVWRRVERELSGRVSRQLRIDGAPSLAELAHDRGGARLDRPGWAGRARTTPVTVIVCTRNRPDMLERCLESLKRLQHDHLEIIVVDNAPADDSTARLVQRMQGSDSTLRYVCEISPGLSRARNRGMDEATGEILAYTDDDVVVDPLWIAGLLRGFSRRRDVGCVTGLVASTSLEHAAEQYFDARVSWSSSFEYRLYTAVPRSGDSRVHPYAAGSFGTGANAAFRAGAIREMGGFDECLGAGSPSDGGEDLDAFVRVLQSGYSLCYEPAALVWHEHRVSADDLRMQMYEYGKGFTAYLCKSLLSRHAGVHLALRLPYALGPISMLVRRSEMAARQTEVGHRVREYELLGFLVGPSAYLYARLKQGRRNARGPTP
jgi:O-antigen biosynthesis protein